MLFYLFWTDQETSVGLCQFSIGSKQSVLDWINQSAQSTKQSVGLCQFLFLNGEQSSQYSIGSIHSEVISQHNLIFLRTVNHQERLKIHKPKEISSYTGEIKYKSLKFSPISGGSRSTSNSHILTISLPHLRS